MLPKELLGKKILVELLPKEPSSIFTALKENTEDGIVIQVGDTDKVKEGDIVVFPTSAKTMVNVDGRPLCYLRVDDCMWVL